VRFAVGVLLAVALSPGATLAAPARDALIRPGVGIAKARLGMTEAQVRRSMGRPQAVTGALEGFGRSVVELQYGYGSYNVRLAGRKGRERVVAVTTFFAAEKTANGVGVGSLESQVKRAHPDLRCEAFRTRAVGEKYAIRGLRRLCFLGESGDARTVFVVRGPGQQTRGPDPSPDPPLEESWPREARVFEVIVRAAGYEHPDERKARDL
jgi:hypothetical protein